MDQPVGKKIEIVIPVADWLQTLADAIERAPQGASVIVQTQAVREIGERGARRMGRDDLTFTVRAGRVAESCA